MATYIITDSGRTQGEDIIYSFFVETEMEDTQTHETVHVPILVTEQTESSLAAQKASLEDQIAVIQAQVDVIDTMILDLDNFLNPE